MYYPMIEIHSLKMTNSIKTKNEKSFQNKKQLKQNRKKMRNIIKTKNEKSFQNKK
jgi:hypothetical protein